METFTPFKFRAWVSLGTGFVRPELDLRALNNLDRVVISKVRKVLGFCDDTMATFRSLQRTSTNKAI